MLTRIGDYEGNKAKLLNAYKMKVRRSFNFQ